MLLIGKLFILLITKDIERKAIIKNAKNTIPNDLLPGFYTPKLNLSGIDADSSAFRQDNLLLDRTNPKNSILMDQPFDTANVIWNQSNNRLFLREGSGSEVAVLIH